MRKQILIIIVLLIAFFTTSCSIQKELAEPDSVMKEVNFSTAYDPILLDNNDILYTSFSENDVFVFGKYNLETKKEKEIGTVEHFYISQGLPVYVHDIAYMPITLSSMEHQLLKIDLSNYTLESIPFIGGLEAIDYVSSTPENVFVLVKNADLGNIYGSVIYRYNDDSRTLEKFILSKNQNERILAFSCYENTIFTVVEKINSMDSDFYIESYDSNSGISVKRINLNSVLKNEIAENGIVQFYVFKNYIYFRDYSDCGYIAAIKDNNVNEVFHAIGLRIVNSECIDNFVLFFIRENNRYYILNTDEKTLISAELKLSNDESIRNIISDYKNVLISGMDTAKDFTYKTEHFYLISLEYLKQKANTTIYSE